MVAASVLAIGVLNIFNAIHMQCRFETSQLYAVHKRNVFKLL